MPTKRTLEVTPHDLNYLPSEIEGECIILAVIPILYVRYKFVLFVILSILTLGIPLLLILWYPSLVRYFYYNFVPFSNATHLFIQNYDNQVSIVEKRSQTIFNGEAKLEVNYFVNRYLKYIIKDDTATVLRYEQAQRLSDLMSNKCAGWSTEDAGSLALSFGPGAMIIERPTAFSIFVGEIFRPLYMFLIFNVVVQLKLQYYYFCVLITLSAVLGIIITIIQVMKVNDKIFEMSYYEIPLHVLRNGNVSEISSMDIVPGDLVFFNKTIRLPFEGVLLEGQLLINECVLTGESVPVAKKPESIQNYRNGNKKIDKSCFLYEGSTIVQINSKKKMLIWQQYRNKYGVPVCVTKTNFTTLKGQLIRKILYPNQLENQFQQESTKFLIFIFFVSIISYIFLTLKLIQTIDYSTIISRGLDLISIAVPPTLPISMTIGIIYAIEKLKKKEIFTISPNQIIQGGLLDTMCFDKTGTLTHDHMNFKTLVPCNKKQFQQTIDVYNYVKHQKMPHFIHLALLNMASNHTVVKVEEDNQLIGDPMEIKLLQFSGCTLQTDCEDNSILFTFAGQFQSGVVYRRFDFDSDLQRMSVVAKLANGVYHIFTKGSPEIMQSIMTSQSMPSNYKQKLRQYASSGFRILAIASRQIKDQWKTADRVQIQSALEFNGFQIFENGLKTETRAAIEQLRSVDINPIMITGDNPITASNIGYQSAILDPNSKTLIVDYSQTQMTEQEFIYSCEGLADVPFKREEFKRKSNKNKEINENPKLEYVNQLLQKMEMHNYNICLTGAAFNHLFAELNQQTKQRLHPFLVELIQGTKILARTKPSDKAKVVKIHQHLGRIVGMCGDGANDCAALNQANLGLSLSDTQASIAAAFTAKQRHIGSMVELIKQSRAGLATNYSLFNIMACYALIQYTSSLLDQYFYSYPAQDQFIYWDLFLNFIFVFLLGNIATVPKLSKQRPQASLLSTSNITKLVFFYIILVAGLITAILAVRGPFADDVLYWQFGGEENNLSRYRQQGGGDFLLSTIENNVIFVVSNFYYLSSIVIFTISAPWKEEFYTYFPFIGSFIIVFIYTVLIAIVPQTRLGDFNLQYLEDSQKLNIFLLATSLGIAIMTTALERCVLNPFFRQLQLTNQQQKLNSTIE